MRRYQCPNEGQARIAEYLDLSKGHLFGHGGMNYQRLNAGLQVVNCNKFGKLVYRINKPFLSFLQNDSQFQHF